MSNQSEQKSTSGTQITKGFTKGSMSWYIPLRHNPIQEPSLREKVKEILFKHGNTAYANLAQGHKTLFEDDLLSLFQQEKERVLNEVKEKVIGEDEEMKWTADYREEGANYLRSKQRKRLDELVLRD